MSCDSTPALAPHPPLSLIGAVTIGQQSGVRGVFARLNGQTLCNSTFSDYENRTHDLFLLNRFKLSASTVTYPRC